MRKPVFMPCANNKGADQPVHLHSLITAFVVRCLDSIIPYEVNHTSEKLRIQNEPHHEKTCLLRCPTCLATEIATKGADCTDLHRCCPHMA